MNAKDAISYLRHTVQPSLGCTEPACAALCCGAASETGIGEIKSLKLVVNPGLYKNAMSVAIPGFDEVGMSYAAALGALLKRTDKELQIFEDLTPEIAKAAKKLVADKKITVTVDYDQKGLYARCEIEGSSGRAAAEIRGSHTNIVRIIKDGQIIFEKGIIAAAKGDPFEEELKKSTIEDIVSAVEDMKFSDISFLLEGIPPNEATAAYGKDHPGPVGIASTLYDSLGNSLMERMMKKVGTSIEARLGGALCTVMSSAGSGSKGLAVILPISEAAGDMHASDEKLARALALGHLVNSYINLIIGKLSAFCTCAAGASVGASCGLTYLWGGSAKEIGYAINNMTGAVAGMICDGGKTGCGLKLTQATSSAYLSARMAVSGHTLRPTDGICDQTPEACIAHLASLANKGMKDADKEILDIMLNKKLE